jgi:copper transport protein
MAMDGNHKLWVAEHIINKIAVIDPPTGTNKEVTIPNKNPFVQWITADSKGNIWLAEQRGNSLAVVTSNPKLGQVSKSGGPTAATNQASNGKNANNNNISPGFLLVGLSYADVVGPSVAAGIIVCAFFYAKSVINLKGV